MLRLPRTIPEVLDAPSGFQGLDLKSLQLVFPDRPLGVGDSWTDHLPATIQVPVPLIVTYTVTAFETIKGMPCVKIATTVRSEGPSVQAGVSLSVKAAGIVHFDYGVGRMVLNNVTSNMRMDSQRFVNKDEKRITTSIAMNMRLEYRY